MGKLRILVIQGWTSTALDKNVCILDSVDCPKSRVYAQMNSQSTDPRTSRLEVNTNGKVYISDYMGQVVGSLMLYGQVVWVVD